MQRIRFCRRCGGSVANCIGHCWTWKIFHVSCLHAYMLTSLHAFLVLAGALFRIVGFGQLPYLTYLQAIPEKRGFLRLELEFNCDHVFRSLAQSRYRLSPSVQIRNKLPKSLGSQVRHLHLHRIQATDMTAKNAMWRRFWSSLIIINEVCVFPSRGSTPSLKRIIGAKISRGKTSVKRPESPVASHRLVVLAARTPIPRLPRIRAEVLKVPHEVIRLHRCHHAGI